MLAITLLMLWMTQAGVDLAYFHNFAHEQSEHCLRGKAIHVEAAATLVSAASRNADYQSVVVVISHFYGRSRKHFSNDARRIMCTKGDRDFDTSMWSVRQNIQQADDSNKLTTESRICLIPQ